MFGGMSEVGDKEGVLEVGVVMMWLTELDLDEYLLCLVSPVSNSLVESLLLVISQHACACCEDSSSAGEDVWEKLSRILCYLLRM
jgi:hypothetical protein